MTLNTIISRKTNSKSDNFETPASAFSAIEDYLPKTKVIYMPFYWNGSAGHNLTTLGCEHVIHTNVDFFTNNFTYDYVIDNPPFSKKRDILSKLKNDQTPFILLLPPSVLHTKYFREMFAFDRDIQIIIPKSRIHYISGSENEVRPYNCPFDTIYLCWRMGLEREINWLR